MFSLYIVIASKNYDDRNNAQFRYRNFPYRSTHNVLQSTKSRTLRVAAPQPKSDPQGEVRG